MESQPNPESHTWENAKYEVNVALNVRLGKSTATCCPPAGIFRLGFLKGPKRCSKAVEYHIPKGAFENPNCSSFVGRYIYERFWLKKCFNCRVAVLPVYVNISCFLRGGSSAAE